MSSYHFPLPTIPVDILSVQRLHTYLLDIPSTFHIKNSLLGLFFAIFSANTMASSSDLALLPSTSNADKPHLLSMPSEIRQIILNLACHGTINIRLQCKRRHLEYSEAPIIIYSLPEYSILLVCKQMRDEAKPILLEQIFSLHIDCSFTIDWDWHSSEVLSRVLSGLYRNIDFLQKAAHIVELVALTFDHNLYCATPLGTSTLFINCFPALRELHLGSLTPWTEAFNTLSIRVVRDISARSHTPDHWAGCQAVRCRASCFILIGRLWRSTRRCFQLTFDAELVASNEVAFAVGCATPHALLLTPT